MSVWPLVFLSSLAQALAIVATDQNELNKFLFGGDYELIDLTFPFDEDTVYWPDSKNFTFMNQVAQTQSDGSWYASNDMAAGEHGGTHIDAPYHFARAGKHVGDLPLAGLVLPLIIVDVSSQVNGNPDFVLYKRNLDFMLNDNFGKPCVVVFKFGWSQYFYDRQRYLGLNESGTLNFPGLSAEVANWIVTSYKNIVGVGVDVASLDSGSSTDFPAHKILLGAGKYGLENVDLSRDVPSYGCAALALPMKIAKGTGAPLRFVAICPKKLPVTFHDKK